MDLLASGHESRITRDSINGQPLIEFTLAAGRSDESLRVESATLYVRAEGRGGRRARMLRPTLWAFVVSNNGSLRLDELAGHARRRPHRAWQQLDVTRAAQRWLAPAPLQPDSQRDRPLRLLVDCSGCAGRIRLRLAGDAQYAPLLKLSVAAAEGRRKRRHALDCGSGPRGHCCRQRHYISFRELGWDDWIVAPAGYYANYCRGACARTPDTFLNHHRHVLEEAARHAHAAHAAPAPARCCAPTRFSALSLVYIAPDSTIVKRDLSDMVVEECGCP